MKKLLILCFSLVLMQKLTAQVGTYTFSTAEVVGQSVTETVGEVLMTVTFAGGGDPGVYNYSGYAGLSGNALSNNTASSSMVLTFNKTVSIASLRLADGGGSSGTFILTPTPAGTTQLVTVPPDGGVVADLGSSFQNITAITVTPQVVGETYWILDDVVLQSVLPVELTSFGASMIKGSLLLKWTTATEVNNYGFEIEERSADALSAWKKVGFVSGSGNSASPKEYQYSFRTQAYGLQQYRLKQIDQDGKFSYSGIVEADWGTPARFALRQNFPNPFNPATSIGFDLASDAVVRLTVIDMLGRELAVIVNGPLRAGAHAASFDGRSLATGLYLYRLDAVGTDGTRISATKTMLLLK